MKAAKLKERETYRERERHTERERDIQRESFTTWWSPEDPLLYVQAILEEHCSAYQGNFSRSVAELIDRVYGLITYPSQLQLSPDEPPLPDAHTKIEPKPFRP